jgi:hypothetical protein
MAGFLDASYGAGDERRARMIKLTLISVVLAAALAGLLYFFFRNYRQEQQARRFFELLSAHNYPAAYEMWVSSDSERSAYPMGAFLQDWGPNAMDVHKFTIMDAESCGNSVIVDTDLGPSGDKKVWINRESLELSWGPPYDGCIQQNRIYNFYRNVKYRLHGRTYK